MSLQLDHPETRADTANSWVAYSGQISSMSLSMYIHVYVWEIKLVLTSVTTPHTMCVCFWCGSVLWFCSFLYRDRPAVFAYCVLLYRHKHCLRNQRRQQPCTKRVSSSADNRSVHIQTQCISCQLCLTTVIGLLPLNISVSLHLLRRLAGCNVILKIVGSQN